MNRVVVIGHGMVGSRFVDDLVAADPVVEIVVLAKEDAAPYNRVLLPSVVAGTVDAASLEMSTTHSERVTVIRGAAAVSVDREAKVVTDSLGGRHEYDRLVFATGSAARLPGVQGIAEGRGLIENVAVLKELADATKIVGALKKSRRAVVLGAGVLGLEVATALANRGLRVTIVHHADRLMERQLGSAASLIATSSLRRLGVEVRIGATVARAITKHGKLNAVRLDDGTEILTDLLVMCAGTIPEATLARNAGLPCGRGITVGANLASPADPAVFAIGDCAEPAGGASGLVAAGWEQARRLVAAWAPKGVALSGKAGSAAKKSTAGRDDEHEFPASTLVRVKASGLDVVTMGLSGKFDHGGRDLRAVRISDPAIGRFVEVVVSNGLLVGATCIGDSVTAANLTALYTRTLPVPSDPAHLIVRPLAGAAPTAVAAQDLKDEDLVCKCNAVSKGVIMTAVSDGCSTRAAVAKATRATTGCGDCARDVDALLTHSASHDLALSGATKG